MVYDKDMKNFWNTQNTFLCQMKKKTTEAVAAALTITALTVSNGMFVMPALPVQADNQENSLQQQQEDRRAIPVESNEIQDWPTGPAVSAESAVLMEADTGTILYAKNIHEHLYPASITKVLTCLIAAENCSMDEMVTFSAEAINSVPSDGSNAGIDAGQQLNIEDSLKCILIASANEVASGVAEHVGGSIPEFVNRMNERARELGCVDSHFANANGLHDENHYTSAYDMALITREFFKNELLSKIAGTRQLHLYPSQYQPDEIWVNNTNQIIKNEIPYEYYVGGKTGYTDPAHSTLVSCAEKDGMRLICVVLKEDAPAQYQDTISLFQYGFQNFKKLRVADYETRYTMTGASFFSTTNAIFGNSRPFLSLNGDASIVLPNSASFEKAQADLTYEGGNTGELAEIQYTFNEVPVGSASIDFADYNRSTYEFDSQLVSQLDTYVTDNSEDGRIIFINVKKVILVVAVLFGVILVEVTIHALLDNYNIFGSDRRRSRRRRKKSQRYRGKYHNVDF